MGTDDGRANRRIDWAAAGYQLGLANASTGNNNISIN
jgi:hypothetical protein